MLKFVIFHEAIFVQRELLRVQSCLVLHLLQWMRILFYNKPELILRLLWFVFEGIQVRNSQSQIICVGFLTRNFALRDMIYCIFQLFGTYICWAQPSCHWPYATANFIKSFAKNFKVDFAFSLFVCKFRDVVRNFKNRVKTILKVFLVIQWFTKVADLIFVILKLTLQQVYVCTRNNLANYILLHWWHLFR